MVKVSAGGVCGKSISMEGDRIDAVLRGVFGQEIDLRQGQGRQRRRNAHQDANNANSEKSACLSLSEEGGSKEEEVLAVWKVNTSLRKGLRVGKAVMQQHVNVSPEHPMLEGNRGVFAQ